jgi:MbtH protein
VLSTNPFDDEIGTRSDCLAYVEEHWTDMRPRSLREAMAID